MGKIIDNRQLVDAPGALRQRRYGLFDVATRLPMDRRVAAAGIQFLTDHCGPAELYDQTCTDSPVKPYTEGSDLMGADPFWVIVRKRCGSVGRTPEEMVAAARSQLDAQDQTRVEDVVWDGGGLATIDAADTLTGSGATVVTPLAPGAGAAIAALENAAYQVYGYRGVIHVNTQAEGALKDAGVLDRLESGVWRTAVGTAVSLGAGYDITGPADAAPDAGFVWAFMTAPVFEWSMDVAQPEATRTLDRSLNQWDVVAERIHAVAWECPEVFAVQVPLAAPAASVPPAVP